MYPDKSKSNPKENRPKKKPKDEPHRGLMELQHVVFARVHFLRKYMDNLQSNLPLQCVYLDDTWIFENGTVSRSQQDNSHKNVKRIKVDGKRNKPPKRYVADELARQYGVM
ncbi:uncharacterized protein BDFB_012773 [Asbolus verrucosus]|uniref:Uncharacterized protein n=1 Tax=Asbolus verrucosus TaxID=1661398 RepID=A0A482WAT8_ASBVE|nr:uncharacterized protein BDFB_012773 [Asbolus verrucosus]